MNLPPLRGTPKQVKWATTIRANTFKDRDAYGIDVLTAAEKVDDSTWWIANNSSLQQLVPVPKPAAPHQLVGGPPAPLKSGIGASRQRIMERAGDEPETNVPCPAGDLKPGEAHPEPHDAELFAASVCRHPLLAEIAVLGTLARLYKGEVGQMLKWRAKHKLDKVRDTIIAEMDKDIDGLKRIIGS